MNPVCSEDGILSLSWEQDIEDKVQGGVQHYSLGACLDEKKSYIENLENQHSKKHTIPDDSDRHELGKYIVLLEMEITLTQAKLQP